MSPPDEPRSIVVTVGDELLLGRTVDGNAAWLGRRLSELGLPVRRRYSAADQDEEIRELVGRALSEAELVVVTGGLGPTRDDRTRDAVASLLGRPLRTDPEILRELEARFRARGFERMPELNLTQAQVPEGATVLPNALGTAPGLALESRGRWVLLLPGVPTEMRALFDRSVPDFLAARYGNRLSPVHHRTLHTTGVAESALAERLEPVLARAAHPVSVAFLPDLRGVDLRLTARARSPEQASGWLDALEAELGPLLEDCRFEAESGDVVEPLARALTAGGRRLAVAESCTGGLVGTRLTDRPGASRFFVGGVLAYEDRVKVEALGVDPDVLARHGAVSEATALQMAAGVARRFGSDTALAVTGVAGPEGGTPEKPVGTVWWAVAVDGAVEARSARFGGERAQVRERAAQAVLFHLLRLLERGR